VNIFGLDFVADDQFLGAEVMSALRFDAPAVAESWPILEVNCTRTSESSGELHICVSIDTSRVMLSQLGPHWNVSIWIAGEKAPNPRVFSYHTRLPA